MLPPIGSSFVLPSIFIMTHKIYYSDTPMPVQIGLVNVMKSTF